MTLVTTASRLLRTYCWETARFFLHTTVTCTYVGLYSYMLYSIRVTDILTVQHKFILNGFSNVLYFFSIWAMAAETICFCSYSFMDVIKMYCLLNKKSKLYSLLRPGHRNLVRKTLFSIIFPLSMVVAMLFWVFYYMDRELIYPEVVDQYFTPFMNHIVHTNPVPLSILYMFFDVEEEPPKRESLKILTITIIIYASVFTYANHNKDEWIYPVLDYFSPSQARCILGLALMSAYVYLFLGHYIFSKIKDVRSYFDENKLKSH